MRSGWLVAALVAVLVAACHHGPAPAEVPSCSVTADHVRGLLSPESPRATWIRDAFAARCEADGWDDDARACVVATMSLRKPRHCKAMLTPDQRAALDRDLAMVAATPATVRLPPVCREYGALLDRLGGCAAVPDTTRGELELAYRQLTQSWMRGRSDVQGLELQCRAMIDGLRQAGAAKCGW